MEWALRTLNANKGLSYDKGRSRTKAERFGYTLPSSLLRFRTQHIGFAASRLRTHLEANETCRSTYACRRRFNANIDQIPSFLAPRWKRFYPPRTLVVLLRPAGSYSRRTQRIRLAQRLQLDRSVTSGRIGLIGMRRLLVGVLTWCLWSALAIGSAQPGLAQVSPAGEQSLEGRRVASLEVYFDGSQPEQLEMVVAAEKFAEERGGIRVRRYDLDRGHGTEEARTVAQQRLEKIAAAGRLVQPQLPLWYGANTILHAMPNRDELTRRLEKAFRIDIYVRAGCSRCAEAKKFVAEIRSQYPAFEFHYRDIGVDTAARDALNQLVARYRRAATSTPVFHLFNQMVVGFDGPRSSGTRLTELLDKWTAPEPSKSGAPPTAPPDSGDDSGSIRALFRLGPNALGTLGLCVGSTYTRVHYVSVGRQDALPIPDAVPPHDQLPFPDEPALEPDVPPTIELPWMGRVAVGDWGMPAFTLIVGLVDGFNPCAMWVLLFLLSILVNLHSRRRILLVAGTFVLVSGAVYFAFMAAWLNVFLLVGYLRPVQISLAVIAILVGAIHIKDFFAFHQGPSLSIPESAKPGIYQRVRAIVSAENLLGAMIGVCILALLVNVVELLCTAGLPALYTQILTQHDYSRWENYGYLVLYNIAYMFDDGLMVAAVVLTLEKTKMQEHHGRWLKLISGIAIATLGVLMLFRPEWLF